MTLQTHSLFIYLLLTFINCMSFVVILNFFFFFIGEKEIDLSFKMGECLKNKNRTTLIK